ncbi:hypothetical protein B0H14DRAFT_2980022 [Mycena olivaceomarginata]|nr:hypothetical protein B0H14DRAFT_2980022 [Mycena olivaceomarginata]
MPATVQVLPLVVLVLIPILTLRLFAFFRPRARSAGMALGALLPWNWGYSPHEKDSRDSTAKKRRVRTRAEQVSEQKKNGAGEKGGDDDAHFPGLVNMSGTHCFMNLTLQALASLSNLPPYLLGIRTRAEALDVPTPVVDAHIDLLAALNTPSARSPSSRPSVRPRPPSAPLTPLHPPPPPPPLRRPL